MQKIMQVVIKEIKGCYDFSDCTIQIEQMSVK